MNTFSDSSTPGASALEVKAEFLAVLLRAGMDDDFDRRFKSDTKNLTTSETAALVASINGRLASGMRRRHLKVVLSQTDAVTLIDRSKFFGNSFSVARQTFAT